MAPPAKFDRDQLQRTALALVDEGGLEALSMRALARELGTGAMTLYNYVRDREDLEALIVDAVMSEAGPIRAEEDWRAAVRHIAEAIWQAVSAHPNAIPLILTRRVQHTGTLAVAEPLLEALARSGRQGEELLAAFRLVTGFILGLAQARLDAGGAGEGAARPSPVDSALQLDPERFPRVREIGAAAAGSTQARQLQAGMDIILAGLDRPSGRSAR